MWGHSGKLVKTSATPRTYICGARSAWQLLKSDSWFAHRLFDHLEGALHIFPQIGKIGGQQRLLRIDDHINRSICDHTIQTDGFAQAPLHAVALDRATQPASHSETHSEIARLPAPQVEHGHMGGEMTPSFLVHAL